ncbi:Uncharacterised protein [Mycobacteroides abscessus subsp. abscessus]|nr:Uncharacterised protein [Mycobacteroides abscessus subsp. abscessus]
MNSPTPRETAAQMTSTSTLTPAQLANSMRCQIGRRGRATGAGRSGFSTSGGRSDSTRVRSARVVVA